MNKVPVMVLRNKSNPDRYLAASMDVGDWDDENLDVTLNDIQNAYMVVRKDLSRPTAADFEEHKALHAKWKQVLIEKYGENACISLDFEGVCEHYEPVNIEITQDQYNYSKDLAE
ncbi:hypothetical protein SAMN02799630_02855 [Paenibacillus sp. UNCCL117]|uniref:hypothetical protein n=1 Tax=unclassified Paenibacillus TaxID=185978 RepID=UPI000890DAD1|nr:MULTISPECIES: hypothetical protein [unclassified Paenibacillus]SDD27876.1 hypothetical protein SAMN04488602_107136 [Paenibacillus sp. cl123]SFW41008.1 hypothetical protein SAMN02799630_02855 [Paenibacillus sp. UNCCL117]